ncbi:hypothetical protein ACFVVU_32555 [Kitasatospora sp. NPDC057965]|uniref:hypothetical protein n=1 Tax=Kitasatospora sp. NPDC057965 TaxID=3346291 RepID=UPI0036DA84DB
MPTRLLALLLSLLPLLAVDCGQQHTGAPAAVRSHGTSAAEAQTAPHCDSPTAEAGTSRNARPTVPVPTPAPAPADDGGSADPPVTRPEDLAGTTPTPGPRGPLLVTGRWRI